MKKLLMFCMMSCVLICAGSASALVVNVDVATGSGTLSGQGAYAEPGNNFWNAGNFPNNDAGGTISNLIASDGVTATSVSVTITRGRNFSYTANSNAMLGDYRVIGSWTGAPPAHITITGLKSDSSYILYMYGAGNSNNQGALFTMNGVQGSTSGIPSSEYIEGGNYVVLEVTSDVNGQIIGTWANNPGITYGALNGMQIIENLAPSSAHAPVPADGATLVPVTVTSVSWFSPEQDGNGDPIDDPNILSVDGYDVWFGTAEPNELTDTPIYVAAPTQSFSVTLANDATYYWRVDTHVTRPDFSTDVLEGTVWQFETEPSYLAPTVTFNSVVTSLDLMPAQLSVALAYNTDAITSAVFTLLDNDFEFPVGADADVTTTTVDLQNPTADLTTDTVGTYKVKVAVSDGTTVIEKVAEVVVYADACAAQKSALTGPWVKNYYDINSNCLVGLEDLAAFVDQWLNDTSMKTQASLTQAQNAVFLELDIQVEAEDAISLTDPNYAAGQTDVGSNPFASGGQLIPVFSTGSLLTYEVVVPETGAYTLWFRAFHEWGRSASFDLVTDLILDGDPSTDTLENLAVVNMPGADTSGVRFYLYSAGPINLTEGTHLIRLSNAGQYNVGPDVFGFKKN